MRFYCLSSITVIPPKIYSTDFEDICEKERLFFRHEINECLNISYSSVHASDFENLNIYQLTEISIGFIKPYEASPEKVYVLNIYRRDLHFMETLAISLSPFTVDLLESSGSLIEFSIPYSRILMPWTTEHYDLEIKLRCIKNTSVKQVISDEEEAAYDRFEKDIEAFANGNSDLREEAFKHFHLILSETSEPKFLSEKIRKFKKYIEWCCDPETGDSKNVPNNSDYSQKLKSFLQQRDKWVVTDSGDSHLPVRSEFSSSHRNCREIYWISPNFTSLNLENFHSKYLQKITIKNTNLMDHYEILRICISKIEFSNLTDLTLSSCKLQDLPENIFSNLPLSLKLLALNDNNIVNISPKISKLKKLENLNLWKNQFLADDGIPWDYLPHSIKIFNICETSITRIPAEIQRLRRLEYLFASECENLEYISWENISKTIISIDVGGGKALNTVNLREKKNLIILKIVDSQLETFEDALLPEQLETLSLRHNNLRRFDYLALPNLQCLYLTGNEIDKFHWKRLPPSLIELDLSQNNLTFIGNISHLIKLERLLINSNNIKKIAKMDFANLKSLLILELARNNLSKLPKGFENIPNDISLDLSSNAFNGTSEDIDDQLWHRIPKLLLFLRLDYNCIFVLPCAVKNLKMVQLFVKYCNLFYLCSHIADNISYIDIRGNPGIENLPFVSMAGYEELPRNSKQLMKLKNRPDNVLTLKTDNQKLRSTARIYEKNLKYKFKSVNTDLLCDCCACCGEETDEGIVEQIMIMDFFITFKAEREEVEKDWLFIDGIPENLPLGFSPGNWKTNVVTRLCKNCIKGLKSIQNNFDNIDAENKDDNLETKRLKGIIPIDYSNPTNLYFDIPILENPESLIGQIVQVYTEPQKPKSIKIYSVPPMNYQKSIQNSYEQIYANIIDPDIQILPHQQYIAPEHPVYSYNVPIAEWLQQTCNNLGIQFEYYMFQHSIYVPDIYGYTPEMNVEVESDGHCGFRALSILLTGNQKYHGIVRRKIAETILSNNDPHFETYPFFEDAKIDAQTHLSLNPEAFCPVQYWMSCVHLSAAAYLINANICVKPPNDTYGWRLYNRTTFLKGIHNGIFDPNIPTILLDNSSQNHFNAILTSHVHGFLDYAQIIQFWYQ